MTLLKQFYTQTMPLALLNQPLEGYPVSNLKCLENISDEGSLIKCFQNKEKENSMNKLFKVTAPSQ